MKIFNYPIEIWIAVFVAVIVRLKSSVALTWWGAVSTTLVAVGSGVVLYEPLMQISGIGREWEVVVAILVSLTAENAMKYVLEVSHETANIKKWLAAIVTRNPKLLIPDEDQKKDS